MTQPSPQQRLSFRRNWILGGYTADYTYCHTLTSPQLSDLVDTSLNAMYELLPSPQALDCKGRNHHDTIIAGIPGEPDGELFRIGGEIATGHTGVDFAWSPFEASCHTHFHEFQGDHHISYTLNHHHSETIPDWLPWRLLGAAAPIRPRYFRLGIERFQSRFTFASFGYLPQVTDSLLVDVLDSNLVIRLVVERSKWRTTDPFTEFPVYASISAALKRSLSLDISALFTEELSKATGL